MQRLLQGDVGSGKTVVALYALLRAVETGRQGALMAPTETLAEQHFLTLEPLCAQLGVRCVLLTGSVGAKKIRNEIASGVAQIAVGTHALIQRSVEFMDLAVAVVDEQHRFGVEQRQRLFAKAEAPDILVMTATPIPRSLALAIFGDLELSVIDELPPGRQRIKTAVRSSAELEKAYAFMDREIASGAQVYVVYPIIEESEKLNLKPLTTGVETIRKRFPNRRVEMMHGRMSASDKEETMQRFKRGEIDILVSTTVIEVGIDVANASIMLIIDADRFGLSQLHQLRGRVGRGERKSYCILVHDEQAGADSIDRLHVFEATRDGFDVADRDLHLRGPGEFLGTKQSGLPRFRFGNILRDHSLMERARDTAIETIEREGLAPSTTLVESLLGVKIAEAARD